MPAIAHLLQLAARSDKAVIDAPLSSSSFNLDSSGVAGFFGGDSAVAGMATVHLFPYRRWGGWYNSPGSYEIAKQYGQLANSRFWDGLFPGAKQDPALLFGLDGNSGPTFLAARSGSSLPHTGHIAYLIARKTRDVPDRVVEGRETIPESVTVIDLPPAPPEAVQPAPLRSHSVLLASVPIAASAAACVFCALIDDWWSFGCIALGMFSSGVACFIIGSGKLMFVHPTPARGAPPGDGLLLSEDGGILVLRGEEAAVNSLTRGRFVLEYAGERQFSRIGHCSVLLTLQFLIQLLLIPQGTLFGQLMFIASLGVSWAYNTYLSSLEKEDLQTDILLTILRLDPAAMQKFTLGSRTATVVFSCLALQPGEPVRNPLKLLTELIPNDTEVWQRWRTAVADKLSSKQGLTFVEADWKLPVLTREEQSLLRELLSDAQAAYEGFMAFMCPPVSRPESSIRKGV